MQPARSILALTLTLILTVGAAPAQTPPPSLPPPMCAKHGAVTLIGTMPVPRRGPIISLQIAPDAAETEALARDLAEEIDRMKPLEAHMTSLQDYSEALEQTIPQPSPSDDSADAVDVLYAEQIAHRQLMAHASDEMSEVTVGTKGDFTCRGVAPGAYMLLLTERETIPPPPSQDSWGPSLPNKTLYELRIVVPKRSKTPTIRLRAPFTMIAHFQPAGT